MITLLPSVPAHFYHSGYHGYHGYHGHHLCQTRLAIEKRELCHVEYEKECETKTRTFTKITGYEDVDCKEIEVCKFGLCILQCCVWSKVFSQSPIIIIPTTTTRGKLRLRLMGMIMNVRRR